MKYIFVTGGVISSLGKGVAAASIGNLLERRGKKVGLLKFDPYINIDPGTMDPYQHGEIYVTDDGSEADLDLGHYARFTEAALTKYNSVTAGSIYYSVINKERQGVYQGQTVQVIPHITDEIKNAIFLATNGKPVDVMIVEVGGTVGDIESLPFLEAIRQFKVDMSPHDVMYIHLTLLIETATGEIKTKAIQHSVRTLREIGIVPDILICRSKRKTLPEEIKEKLALFCDVKKECIIIGYDVETVYEIPLIFKEQNLDNIILERLKIKTSKKINGIDTVGWKRWKNMVNIIKYAKDNVDIAVVGKYIKLRDAYKSIAEALIHAGVANNVRVNIIWQEAEELLNDGAIDNLANIDGILVPGGFGYRGIEGKIKAITYARENNIPFFGICLGMQCSIIEIANNIANLEGANSTEVNQATNYPVVCLLPGQEKVKQLGKSMRLGLYKTKIYKPSLAYEAYKKNIIYERHRHRYIINKKYIKEIEAAGVLISGVSTEADIIEIIELKNHRWFLATQFHPEFKSKPLAPHPLFVAFIKASITRKNEKN